MPPKIETSDQVTKGYHGTTLAVAQDVMQTYFKMSPPDAGAFLGEGAYFFDNQLSQAKRWATTRNTPGTKTAVIESGVKYGRLLNLTDKEQRDDLEWFAREYQRKTNETVTLPTIIDIVADRLGAEVVKAMRIPHNPSFLWQSRFSADVEVILAVREVKNILSKEIIWSQIAGLV